MFKKYIYIFYYEYRDILFKKTSAFAIIRARNVKKAYKNFFKDYGEDCEIIQITKII